MPQRNRRAANRAAPRTRPSVSDQLLAIAGQDLAAPAPADLAVPAPAHDPLGAALMAMRCERELDQRIAQLRASLAQSARPADTWMALADLEMKRGRRDAAIEAYRQCLALDPGRDGVRHLIDALSGGRLPARAPDAYVAGLFDAVAQTFDETLVHWLDYRAPEMTFAMAKAVLGPRPPLQRILDLGCGTGLNGPLFRPLAQRLDGVDLSPRMVEKARARRLYDELAVAEIGQYLAACARRYSLVLATDVLVYFGDLGGVFAGVGGVLKPGGRFIATVELGAGAPFALGRAGRYVHSQDYVRAAAKAAGLGVTAAQAGTLRQEAGKPVAGMCYALQKRD